MENNGSQEPTSQRDEKQKGRRSRGEDEKDVEKQDRTNAAAASDTSVDGGVQRTTASCYYRNTAGSQIGQRT